MNYENLVLNHIENTEILLNKEFEIVYFNKKAKDIFNNIDLNIHIQDFFNNDKKEIERLINYLTNNKSDQSFGYIFYFDQKYLNITIKRINSHYYLLDCKNIEDEYLKNVLNVTDVGYVLTNPNIKNNPVVFVNDFFCKFTGYTRDDIIGKSLNILKYDDSDLKERKEIKNALEKKKSITTILKNKKKNGDIYYNKISISPIFNKYTNHLQFFVGVQSDVTAIVKERIFFENSLNLSESIIIITDGKNLKKINNKFFEIFDFKNFEDFRSKHKCICELFIAKDSDYLMPEINGLQWNKYISRYSDLIHQACMIDKYGEERFFQIRSSGKIFEEEEEEEEVITFTDITTLIKNRQIIIEQSKLAAMGEMISMIAHQWRQPLTTLSTIINKLYLYKELGKLDDVFDDSYTKSNNLIQYMSKTINDFRNFFQEDNSSIKNISVKDLINQSFNLINASFEQKYIHTN